MSKGYEMIGKYPIYLDQEYYLAYAGGSRDLSKKDRKEYEKVLQLPLILQRKELKKIPQRNNPNLIPLKGRDLMSFIKELKFVPFFDTFFEQSHLIKLTDFIIYESIKQKSYDVALRG